MADDSETPTPPPSAAKPTPRRRAPRKTSTTAASSTAKTPAKSRRTSSTTAEGSPSPAPAKPKRAAPAKSRATPAKRGKAASNSSKSGVDKVGGRWGAAAIAGGVAAVGAAATAALLSLRGSSAKGKEGTPALTDGAHQPDGSDSSKSFEAGIADENTIPNE